ncbi:dihydroneopterin aldolase [Pseudooceanicola sp. MF1-13]|uniref:dihydroneopterin aldolase n=1 Tax=Pseudooceanicola sp. MF1-13 TaxID=3379095 RepID=UPI00389121FB
MGDSISQAFGHPIERAEALGGTELRDRISLRDYVTEVEIGAFQAERGHNQRLRFNVVVEVLADHDPLEDDVDRILSYDVVTEAIENELSSERLNLLETLAERVAAQVLAEPQAARVFVRIEKLDRGPGALGVEIVRSKADALPLVDLSEDAASHAPRIIFLTNADIASPDLSPALDRLAASSRPTILCCGPSDLQIPQTGAALVQRRIELLAIEQNAWVLAGRDARCVVVNSRTELDWAMKHDQISVWAPSKMVLDAVEGPKLRAAPVDLAAWLAETLDAAELVVPEGVTVEAEVPTVSAPLSQIA